LRILENLTSFLADSSSIW